MMQPSSEFIVFITHIEPDDTYLKIWGQVDKSNASLVERHIYSLIEHFNQGYVFPSKANRLIGALCCARFQTDGYFRAKILSIRPNNTIVVQFIDYGNIEILSPNDVHLLENIPGSESLQAVPAIAAEFTLANVMPINCVWEDRIIETIKRTLCYNEYRATLIHTINNRYLIKLWYNNEDFSELLVKEHMALPASIQDMFRPKLVLQPQIPQQPPMPMYQAQNKGNMNNYVTMPLIQQNPNINHNANMYHKAFCPDINQYKPTAQVVAPPQSPPVQEALVFKSRVLDIGSKHEVLISCVEDGPQKFSVQVESTKDILTRLMNEINSRPKQSLQEPPLPGSVCLGRYTGDGVLCRAVVMSVMEHKCKLYYVDFGHTEILPYTDIFQLPPEYINPKVLSIRFTLSGLKELNVTQEMKKYFTELVHRKVLVLHVRPPEGPPLIQYGDLYDNNVNIKDMLKKAFPPPAATLPITHSYPQVRQLSKDIKEIVFVSYVESCRKFFVQLESGSKSLDSIMAALSQYANTAAILSIDQLRSGLPCAALYESQWYRAQILDVIGDKVRVVYVDYGNEEVLSLLSIRAIHDDLVTKLPAQALKCTLNGYEVLSPKQDVSSHFEKLVLEKRFYMKVVAAQPEGLLVDLFEFETMRSIRPQLLNNVFCDKTDDSTTSSRNEEIQRPTKTTNNFQSENRDRYNKKHTDSWNHNQNAKSSQDNKPNWRERSPEKQYDNNRREKINYSHRDSPQNDRFAKDEVVNNRYSKDRSEKSYNKYDKGEANTFNRGARGTPRDGNRFGGNERRYNRERDNNFADKMTHSDKDSDSSSRDGTKRGKGGFNRGGFNDDRGGNRDKTDRFQSPGNWNNKKSARSSYRNEKFNDNSTTSNNEFKNDTSNVSYNQTNTCESWGSNGAEETLQSNVIASGGSQFPLINITLGTTKNGEVVFINNPTDFFVQVNPDYLELDGYSQNIAAYYENGGETMQVSEIQRGVCCIAQYSADLTWYRAIIESVEENSAMVKFIDYGNTESVDFTKIKVIQDEFLKLPMQAIRCKLFGLTNMNTNENKYTIFPEKVEEKSLQIEFVDKEDGIYQVLLREIIEGEPNNNYINEEFCTGVDLTQAKATALSKKTFNVTTKKVPVASDYAPSDSKWQVTSYEPDSTYDAIVTWFISPNKFFCQMLNKEPEFKAMMNEIQKTYAGRESVTHTLEVGSAIIAVFSEDKALYRAEVVSIEQMGAYVVQYIDFGNCATLNQYGIYSVEKKFMQLPKLAVQCSLKDIVPNNSSWSKADSAALDNCFNADKYECTFHSFNNNQYTVSLIHNGQNVGDMLVQKNLATFATKISTETACVAEAEVERVDINLLSGQILKMRISNVESTLRFHVQLPSVSKCEKLVNQYMADKNTEVMPRLSSHEMCLGTGCLINANGTWWRAVIVDCSRSTRFNVKLIDTGTCDEIQDSALALPGELSVMQNQSLECSLYEVSASPDLDKQLQEFKGKEVLIYVKKVEDNRLFVKLYDLSGNAIINAGESISPICPLPIISSTQKVGVPYAEHSASIWLQRYSDIEIETKLLEDLAQYYAEPRQKLKPDAHLLCAAKSLDKQWYRGKIISHTETTAYVHYIDYGNNEEVSLDSIMVLEPQFYEPHMLAINASLPVTLIGTEAEQVMVLQTHLMDKELTAVFYNVHNKWTVELMENGEKFSDKFHSLNLVKEEETTKKTATDKFDVYVSHVDSPSQFWLQRVDEATSLTDKQAQLQQEISDFPAIDGIPEEGSLCVAVYSIDNLWYRAEVLDADEDITTVRFIDYGNTDVIDNKAGNIRQMPESWGNLDRFAQKCRLDVIPVDTEDWNETICERFTNLVISDTLQALVVADTTPKRVELFINDKSISETLVEEKHAVSINIEQEPVDEIVDLELDPHSAFVCHINSPSEFWVQEEKSVADLEVMVDRFMVADMFSKIDDVKEGLLCVAKFPDDGQWYRARIISHDNNGTQVIYIDYGNSAISTEIRAIPEDLANIPPLSRKCSLELPSHIQEWSEKARKEFINLSADGATIFLLDVLKEQENSLVRLTLDGQNVADILGKCEQHLPVIEERLPPIGEENSPNVVISHINDPSEFWIQTESNMNELEVMSDRLQDAESFLTLSDLNIGTVCAARYPEDGCWYRAKIVACHENGTEVLYLDYGNSAVTEELRILPEDIVNIPVLSKRCTLEKPSNIAAWSEEAGDKFRELAAEGATMFKFETLDEGNPIRVRLNMNGKNVIDLLLNKCESIPQVDAAPEVEVTETKIENISFNVEKNDGVKTSNLNQTEQELNNQTEEPEDVIDKEVLKSPESSDANKECGYKEEQNTTNLRIIEENTHENSEINKVSKDISTIEINKDLDINNEVISTNAATNALCFKRLSPIELSVDDIIESMIKNATDDRESQEVVNSDLLIKNEEQLHIVAQTDTDKSLSQTQSASILKSIIRDVTENVDSMKISSEKQLQDITQLDTSQIEEQKVHVEMRSDISKPQTAETTSGSAEEQQISSGAVDGAFKLNGTHNLEKQSENIDADNNSSTSSDSTCTIKTVKSITKTDPEVQHPVIPKTPHSEKLVTATVNPFVQTVTDSVNEDNEAVPIVDNIPKHGIAL